MCYIKLKVVRTILLVLFLFKGFNSERTTSTSENQTNGNNSYSKSDDEIPSVFEQIVKWNQRHNGSIRTSAEQFSEKVENMFKNYISYLPPFMGSYNYIFWLNISIVSKELIEIDEVEERLSVVMEFMYKWKDERLAWESETLTNDSKRFYYLPIDESKIWTPTVEISNQHHSKTQDDGKKSNSVLYVFMEGSIIWSHTKRFNTMCNIDTTYFPFDRQICRVHFFAPIPYLNSALNFSHEVLNNRLDNGNWRLIDTRVYQSYSYYNLIYHMTVEFIFERKPFAPILILIIPVFMLVSLAPLVFLLPKDGGDRLGLALTVLLAVSVYMTLVADNLPSSSDPVPYITIVFFTWYVSSAVIVVLILLNAKLYNKRNNKTIPRFLQRLVLISRRCSCLEDDDNEHPENNQTCIDESEAPLAEKKTEANDSTEYHSTRTITWQHVSLCLDKWFVIMFYCIKLLFAIITFITLYHGDKHKTDTEETHFDKTANPYSYGDINDLLIDLN
ncbi:acetylcholine receptor subunit alpha-1-B-like [Mya arenaria]|uniref:acetylcholine receptor subunit alpha-1-B-like n=1 Tax=Mya arenaria TaxID=6604 RepID=UPI0022E69685|nr:acetylcholine receptor subunit alpha-1-B-like [Mya arenaria]